MKFYEFVIENLTDDISTADAYKQQLIKTLPQMERLFSHPSFDGWHPSKEQMLAAIETAYIVMQRTGDVQQAGRALMDELKILYRMSQGQKVSESFTTQFEQHINENLRKWFQEKWVRFGPDGKIRGQCARGDSSEGKPKCLPQSKAHALGKKGRRYAASKKRREDPNPERTGKAINVKTKKDSSVDENNKQYEIRPLDNDTIKKIKIKLLTHWQSKDLKNIRIRHADNDIFHVIGSYPMGETVDIEYQFDRLDRKIKYIDKTVINEQQICPECGGPAYSSSILAEKKDACYHKVRSRYKVWPSAYASGALVQCRKKGAKNWGNKS